MVQEISESDKIETLLSQSRSFFVIDSTGILQHYENFLPEPQEPDLYAGLFSAVNAYAKELKAGSIQTATLEEHKFVFSEEKNSGYLIVMDVNNQMSDDNGTWLINQIVRRFKDIEALKADDIRGQLSLETLFSERGKSIDWGTIKAIRESAVQSAKAAADPIETLNLSKVNLKNKLWVRIRKMIGTMVEHQKSLAGSILIIRNQLMLNKLYSGRGGFERLGDLYNYMQSKFDQGSVGQDVETEMIQIGDLYCSIFTIFHAEGGLLAIASVNGSTISRLITQVERLVSAIERLGNEL
ncbi:MAG: hypothetical protein ACW99Q_05040 [Candidatus Kariarchaeaceae archaeon]|jgi:hypothetical protein